jgi:hypothetical protein
MTETAPGATSYDIDVPADWKQVMGQTVGVLPFPTQVEGGQSRIAEITPAVAAALEEAGSRNMDTSVRVR